MFVNKSVLHSFFIDKKDLQFIVNNTTANNLIFQYCSYSEPSLDVIEGLSVFEGESEKSSIHIKNVIGVTVNYCEINRSDIEAFLLFVNSNDSLIRFYRNEDKHTLTLSTDQYEFTIFQD